MVAIVFLCVRYRVKLEEKRNKNSFLFSSLEEKENCVFIFSSLEEKGTVVSFLVPWKQNKTRFLFSYLEEKDVPI